MIQSAVVVLGGQKVRLDRMGVGQVRALSADKEIVCRTLRCECVDEGIELLLEDLKTSLPKWEPLRRLIIDIGT